MQDVDERYWPGMASPGPIRAVRPLVLIVEPEEEGRGLYFDWFCSAGFDVMCAVDGTVAHGLAERYRPDLVVTERKPGFPFWPPRISGMLHLHTAVSTNFCRVRSRVITSRRRGEERPAGFMNRRGPAHSRVSGRTIKSWREADNILPDV
jgi:hypothetical protein